MHIKHIHNNHFLEHEGTEPVAVFLRGGKTWFSQFTRRQSRYEGWFLGEETTVPHPYYKILDRIEIVPVADIDPTEVTVRTTAATLGWDTESFTIIPSGEYGLVITSPKVVPFRLSLDMRHIYTYPEFGRMYGIDAAEGGFLVMYSDETLNQTLFLHIRGSFSKQPLEGSWQLFPYPRDAARHSAPEALFSYVLSPLQADRLNLGCAFTKEAAFQASLEASQLVLPSFEATEKGEAEAFAQHTVTRSLEFLTTNDGVYAGFPWFHQFWSRDELLTALGLPPEEQQHVIKRYLALPLHNGELPTYAGSGTTCADGVGWLALLIKEYGVSELPQELVTAAISFFQAAANQLTARRQTPSGLIWSGHNATWMDTIGRSGFRLEVQCMYALVFELLFTLTKEAEFENSWQETRATIRRLFYKDGHLLDGLEENMSADERIRPNIFLAYFLQPTLLKEHEWEHCFTHCLPHLLTEWGGLTSLAKEDPAFQAHSTGENNLSYHQGDSWFFVNNIAALVLRRLGTEKFAKTADALLAASTTEILWHHFLGMHGEIASAADAASWGCGIQGFSGGTYLKALRG
jgi:hypothetical protein